jgi:hypothetical protein
MPQRMGRAVHAVCMTMVRNVFNNWKEQLKGRDQWQE